MNPKQSGLPFNVCSTSQLLFVFYANKPPIPKAQSKSLCTVPSLRSLSTLQSHAQSITWFKAPLPFLLQHLQQICAHVVYSIYLFYFSLFYPRSPVSRILWAHLKIRLDNDLDEAHLPKKKNCKLSGTRQPSTSQKQNSCWICWLWLIVLQVLTHTIWAHYW